MSATPAPKRSLLAIDLAFSVALGQPWLDRPVQQRPVLLVDEEAGLTRLWQRLNAAARYRRAVAGTPLHFISLGGYDFRLQQDVEDLTEHTLRYDAGLVIIDALANVMRGGDENSVLSVQPIFYNLRRIAEKCQAALVVIHHNNKQGYFRGSSVISAAVDHMLSVTSPPQESLISIQTLKARDLPAVQLNARAHIQPDLFWLTPTDEQLPEQGVTPRGLGPTARSLLQFLADNRRANTPAIIQHLGGNAPGYIRKTIYNLMVAGLINRIDGNSRGKIARYELSPHGRKALTDHAKDITLP